MVNKVDDRLNQNDKEQLYAFLLDYSDIFAQSSDDFGQTGRIQHQINTGDSQPIRQQTRRMPTFRRDEAKKLVKEMPDKDLFNRQRVLGLLQWFSSRRRTDLPDSAWTTDVSMLLLGRMPTLSPEWTRPSIHLLVLSGSAPWTSSAGIGRWR